MLSVPPAGATPVVVTVSVGAAPLPVKAASLGAETAALDVVLVKVVSLEPVPAVTVQPEAGVVMVKPATVAVPSATDATWAAVKVAVPSEEIVMPPMVSEPTAAVAKACQVTSRVSVAPALPVIACQVTVSTSVAPGIAATELLPRTMVSLPLPRAMALVLAAAVWPVAVNETLALSLEPLTVMPEATVSPVIEICTLPFRFNVARLGSLTEPEPTWNAAAVVLTLLVNVAVVRLVSLKLLIATAAALLSTMVKPAEVEVRVPMPNPSAPPMVNVAR